MADKILHDADSGEIIEHEEIAADGGRRYPSVTTMTDLIHMLNDGQFNHDCAAALQEFAEKLECLGIGTEKKQKGAVTLKIEVERESDGIYFFKPVLTFKLPPEQHGRTIGWLTRDNRFTPNKPNQGNLFGTVRDVSQDRDVKN